MKTIKFTGEMSISFGVAGEFKPGQEAVTLENELADNLIGRGYFVEVREEAKRTVKEVPAEITI